jgi:hypothetical protein
MKYESKNIEVETMLGSIVKQHIGIKHLAEEVKQLEIKIKKEGI